MTNSTKITGSCLCEAVRYESTSSRLGAGYCHCSKCRKAYGHLYAALVQFNRDDFKITKGELSHYKSSDVAERSFCRDCGSSLLFSYPGQSTLFVLAGTLDFLDDCPFDDSEGSWGHTFTDDKVSWLEINDGLRQHKQSVGFLAEAEITNGERST